MKKPTTYAEKLFQKNRDKVYGFFIDFLNNREISRDLTQDIFVKIIQKENKLEEINDIDGYIYQMCRNLAYDHLKKAAHNKQYRVHLLDLHKAQNGQRKSKTEKKINSDHYNFIIDQSLDKLPDQQRLIFLLSKKEGLSHKKIAKKLGISSHTVRNHLYQAMKTLRSELSQMDVEFLLLLLCVIQQDEIVLYL